MKHLFLTLMLVLASAAAFADAPLRRSISPTQPAWLVHIDNWNDADPQKIIALIPDDIKPYVIFNVSMSISHNEDTGVFDRVPDGYSTARSWVRACAEEGVWCMVQCASGGYSHFPEDDLRFYEELYRDYPNFLGWNYAEQFWGFDNQFSCTFDQRLAHFADLMRLARRYGGYLCISFCGNIWSQSLSPLAMMKRSPDFAAQAAAAPQNLIVCDKYTQSSMFYHYESTNLGAFVAGYTTNFGIRFDQCGWTGELASEEDFPTAAGIAPVLNNWLLEGGTVNDGPELIWQQDFKTNGTKTLGDGYTVRSFTRFPQFDNISIDLYRKILDGTVRIPTREEVVDRSKVVLVDDVNSGSDNLVYNVPETLYDGLYNMDDAKHMGDQTTWFKKTGRYPAIPAVPALVDDLAQSIPTQVLRSEYDSRWKTIAQKKAEFDRIFPEEYTGDAFASRIGNRWLVYNPFKNGKAATADIPLQYNTCGSIVFRLSPYSAAVVREQADSLGIYVNNYRTDVTTLRNDTIVLSGASAQPAVTLTDRASHTASEIVAQTWQDGTLTLIVAHNGPFDLAIACSGSATDRKAVPADQPLVQPAAPAPYYGPITHQCEDFDYKSTTGYRLAPSAQATLTGFHGLGFHEFGTSSQAMLRDTFTLARDAVCDITLRYSAPSGRPRLRIYVNGAANMVSLPQTATGEWAEYTLRNKQMKQGGNQIRITPMSNQYNVYFDEVTVADTAYSGSTALDADRYAMDYAVSTGETAVDSIIVNGRSLTSAVSVVAEGLFSVSKAPDGDFAQSLYLQPDADGNLTDAVVYVRADASNDTGSYDGTVTISADGCDDWVTTLRSTVSPHPVTLVYDFTADRATSSASNPPAKDVSVPRGASATAGVTAYGGDNALKVYSTSGRNGSGALDLGRFTSQATDYSVTWKQRNQTTSEYKVGMMLRAGDIVGTSSAGYSQGFREGYLFIVNNVPSSSATNFRIYKSTSATSLNMIVNKTAAFCPSANEAVWYRATVGGWPSVTLTLEYSTDGTTWQAGASTTDTNGAFQQGATQVAWGLAASRNQFLLDDITFNGVTYDTSVTAIRTVTTPSEHHDAIYNLAGQRVSTMQSGQIYIVGGRKVLAK